jgi:hypothetical protein
MEVVPAQKSYAWGGTLWGAALQAVPNFGFTKGKEWARLDIEDTPSTWITWILNPIWASTGGGYGYSMAAEWYYNFGLAGVVLGMALTGWVTTRLRNNARTSSLALLASATVLAGVAIWSRNIIGHPLKVAVWPVIGVWAIHRFLLLLRSRGASRPSELNPAPGPLTP